MGGQGRISPFCVTPAWTDLRWQLVGSEAYAKRPLTDIDLIVIHHTAGSNRDYTALEIAQIHVAQGWPGIGYHFLVHPDGSIDYVGDLSTSRSHVGLLNRRSVGICLAGNFDYVRPTPAALASVRGCIAAVRMFVGDVPVVGHGDVGHLTGYGATNCPGLSRKDWWEEVVN